MENFNIHEWQAKFFKKNSLNESSTEVKISNLLNKWFEDADLDQDQQLKAVDHIKQWAENRFEILKNRYNK
jgi:hypothetical protein